MPRLFVGTFLSPQQQAELGKLSRLELPLSALWKRKVRWVKELKLHLTWFFLGNVEQVAIPRVKQELEAALLELPSTGISYDTAEFWPSPRMARQLVLTTHDVPAPVQATVKSIRARLTPLVGEPDYKTFKPHITLMRLDSRDTPAQFRKMPLTIPDELPLNTVLPLHQEIAEVSLIESHLGRAAEEYQRLATYKLA